MKASYNMRFDTHTFAALVGSIIPNPYSNGEVTFGLRTEYASLIHSFETGKGCFSIDGEF